MKVPVELKHKPVIVSQDYDKIDGSDAMGLSVGLAQWNDRGKVEASAKVWRHTGEKWSRQSEEMPLHRVIDLAILVARTDLYLRDAYKYKKLYNEDDPQIDRIALQGGALNVAVCTDNPNIDGDIILLRDIVAADGERMGERFSRLAAILREMGY